MADPVIQKRNRANKRAGTMFETALVTWFRSLGYTSERHSKKGRGDEGDVSFCVNGVTFLVEAKNVARINLPDFIRQAQLECEFWMSNRPGTQAHPLAVVKRRNAGVEKSYAVMELQDFVAMVNAK